MLGSSAVGVPSTGLWSSLVRGGAYCLSGYFGEGHTCLASQRGQLMMCTALDDVSSRKPSRNSRR